MTTLTLHYIDWESITDYAAQEWGEHGMDYVPAPDLPEEFRPTVAAILSHPDEVMCGLADLMDEAAGQMCSNPVGWVLHEPEEYGDRGGMEWKRTILVKTAVGVVAVCEDCSPETLYENAAANVGAKSG